MQALRTRYALDAVPHRTAAPARPLHSATASQCRSVMWNMWYSLICLNQGVCVGVGRRGEGGDRGCRCGGTGAMACPQREDQGLRAASQPPSPCWACGGTHWANTCSIAAENRKRRACLVCSVIIGDGGLVMRMVCR